MDRVSVSRARPTRVLFIVLFFIFRTSIQELKRLLVLSNLPDGYVNLKI